MSQAGIASVNAIPPPPGSITDLEGQDSVVVPPDGAGVIHVEGVVVAAGSTPFTTSGNAGTNTETWSIQRTQAVGATDPDAVGLAAFDSAHFTVDANGFVQINGSAIGQTITGQSGGPLSPTAGNWNIFGAAVAAGTTPVASSGSGSTLTLNVQRSQAIASTNATNVGLAAFNSAHFTVDANGFVSASGTGLAQTITGNTGGALPPTAGNWNILGTSTNGIQAAGSGSTLTVRMQSPYADGDFTFLNTAASGNRFLTVQTTDNTNPDIQAAFIAQVGGTGGGDPFIRFQQLSVFNFVMGLDHITGSFKLRGGGNNTSTPSTDNQYMTVTQAGSVTKPLTPCVYAKVGSAVSNFTGNGTQATVIFDTELFDQQSNYNPATGVFTAPVQGRYYVYSSVTFTNLGAGHTSFLHLINSSGGNNLKAVGNPGVVRDTNNYYTVQQSGIINLNASETLQIQVSVSGSTQTVGIEGENFGQYSNLCIALIA